MRSWFGAFGLVTRSVLAARDRRSGMCVRPFEPGLSRDAFLRMSDRCPGLVQQRSKELHVCCGKVTTGEEQIHAFRFENWSRSRSCHHLVTFALTFRLRGAADFVGARRGRATETAALFFAMAAFSRRFSAAVSGRSSTKRSTPFGSRMKPMFLEFVTFHQFTSGRGGDLHQLATDHACVQNCLVMLYQGRLCRE